MPHLTQWTAVHGRIEGVVWGHSTIPDGTRMVTAEVTHGRTRDGYGHVYTRNGQQFLLRP